MTTARVLRFDGGDVHDETDAAAALADAERSGGWVWVQASNAEPETVASVVSSLSLPDGVVAEIVRRQSRSRLRAFGRCRLLVLQPATYDDADETVTSHELDIVIADRLLVTFPTGAGVDLDVAREHARAGAAPSVAVRAILQQTADGYRSALDGLENDVDEIEEQLFGDDPAVSRRIFSLQREVIGLAHATSPLPDVLERLADAVTSEEGLSTEALHELRERTRFAGERVAGLRHTLDDALQIHATLVTQRLDEKMAELTEVQVRQNEQVKKISSWAAIGFAPTLVAGVYGMNFRFMPELAQPWGYPFALGLMVAVSAGLYAVFRRNDWI